MLIICPKCHKHIDVSPILPLGTELTCGSCGTTYDLMTAIAELRNACPTNHTVFVHGAFVYVCTDCAAHTTMMLDMGVEEMCNPRLASGKSQRPHKPSPFTIKCPQCGGFATHTQTVWFEAPRPLSAGRNVFLYDPDHNCGRAVYNWQPDEGGKSNA